MSGHRRPCCQELSCGLAATSGRSWVLTLEWGCKVPLSAGAWSPLPCFPSLVSHPLRGLQVDRPGVVGWEGGKERSTGTAGRGANGSCSCSAEQQAHRLSQPPSCPVLPGHPREKLCTCWEQAGLSSWVHRQACAEDRMQATSEGVRQWVGCSAQCCERCQAEGTGWPV